jgi:hypothetical protein
MRFPTRRPSHFSISCLLPLILAAIACAACGSPSSEEARPSKGSQASEIEITADALHAAYVENGAAGDKRFRGQLLTVNGRVNDLQMFGDRPVINLVASKGRGVIQCYFEPEQAEAVKKITPGKQVKIQGRCDGFVEGAVLIKECIMK